MARGTLLSMVKEEQQRARRAQMLSVRITDGERKRLYAAAKVHGIPAAGLARILIVSGLEDLEAKK